MKKVKHNMKLQNHRRDMIGLESPSAHYVMSALKESSSESERNSCDVQKGVGVRNLGSGGRVSQERVTHTTAEGLI